MSLSIVFRIWKLVEDNCKWMMNIYNISNTIESFKFVNFMILVWSVECGFVISYYLYFIDWFMIYIEKTNNLIKYKINLIDKSIWHPQTLNPGSATGRRATLEGWCREFESHLYLFFWEICYIRFLRKKRLQARFLKEKTAGTFLFFL